ncbi:MAG TPA: PQQ-binding-like beta-propeller repeat protein [Terriglobales bacterium]|nr:PQQ-binding-like beta-propeller repeat protein [Terriglobales bacterium]
MTSCSLAPSRCESSAVTLSAGWSHGGGDAHNTRFQCAETLISPANVGDLKPKWVQAVKGDVSATPTTDGLRVYFPDWGNFLNALDAETGEVIWQEPISGYNNSPSTCRTSPVIVDNGAALVIGDRGTSIKSKGANVIKVDARTGALIWITTVESHPAAQITSSPTVADGVILVGVASNEETFALKPAYACCTFRGSIVALDEESGQILWKTYLVPDNTGLTNQYSGGAIWGGSPVVDSQRKLVYVTTGNNYTVPQEVADCLILLPDSSTCTDPENRIDAILALDFNTGNIKWTYQAQFSDISNGGCLIGVNCMSPRGPDWDFAQGPIFVDSPLGQMIFAAQKNGLTYALNPETGALLWKVQTGTGVRFGSATDGTRIYVANRTSFDRDAGSWSALDPQSGKILWTTNDPGGPETHSLGLAPVSVANGVVYAGSTNKSGATMFGLDAENGSILFSFNSGTPVAGGAAVNNGVVFWGSGYPSLDANVGDNRFFAFGLSGPAD